jgi:hypothetical protein
MAFIFTQTHLTAVGLRLSSPWPSRSSPTLLLTFSEEVATYLYCAFRWWPVLSCWKCENGLDWSQQERIPTPYLRDYIIHCSIYNTNSKKIIWRLPVAACCWICDPSWPRVSMRFKDEEAFGIDIPTLVRHWL